MISRNGSGPQSSATLYQVPDLPSGPALLSVKGTVSNGNLRVVVPGVSGFIDLTGGSLQEVTAMFLAEAGDLITYEVLQDIGQTVVWSVDFYLGLQTDVSYE
jgi:hypothetical protein